jgi:phospholipid N-methyltransferase
MTPGSVDTRAAAPADPKHRSDFWMVFKKFMTQGTAIATPAPSGRFLVKEMLKGIDWDSAKVIVELGAGTGPITDILLKKVRPHTRLMIVEIEQDFCDRLRRRFPNAEIVQGDAAHLDKLLADRGIEHVDHLVSGLPMPSIPHPIRKAIFESAMKCMGPEGVFRQLTVMPYVYWNFYRHYFQDVSFKLVPMNFPPAGVYFCKTFKPGAEDPKK